MRPSDESDRLAKRLDRLTAERPADDRHLGLLAMLASTGLPVAVGLLVDGMVIRGTTCTQEQYVDGLTAAVLKMADVLFKDFPTVRDDLRPVFTDEIARDKALAEADDALLSKYLEHPPASIDDLASGDVKAFVRSRRQEAFFHLADAHLGTAGTDQTVVGLVRIRLSNVSAWWPLEEDRTANVTYGPPGEAITN